MNTKLLMTASALALGAAAIILTFIPEEISHYFNLDLTPVILLQILGALYFGFAILNWTAKANLIGGIYSRPVAIANFSHFAIGGLALIKLALHDDSGKILVIFAAVYLLFAVLFGYVFFATPDPARKADSLKVFK
ncbi:MAG: hypothetical protein ACTHK0_06275 [Ginsengibacter sp.]